MVYVLVVAVRTKEETSISKKTNKNKVDLIPITFYAHILPSPSFYYLNVTKKHFLVNLHFMHIKL